MNITFVSYRILWKGYLVYQIFCKEHPEAGLWVHPDNQMFAGGEIVSSNWHKYCHQSEKIDINHPLLLHKPSWGSLTVRITSQVNLTFPEVRKRKGAESGQAQATNSRLPIPNISWLCAETSFSVSYIQSLHKIITAESVVSFSVVLVSLIKNRFLGSSISNTPTMNKFEFLWINFVQDYSYFEISFSGISEIRLYCKLLSKYLRLHFILILSTCMS